MRFVSAAEFTIIDFNWLLELQHQVRTPHSPACSAMTAASRRCDPTRPDRLVQKYPAARDHDLLGSKFRRDIYNVLKVRERAGTRLIPARRDIPRLGVVLFGTKSHNPNPIPLRQLPYPLERIVSMAIDIQIIAPLQSSQHV